MALSGLRSRVAALTRGCYQVSAGRRGRHPVCHRLLSASAASTALSPHRVVQPLSQFDRLQINTCLPVHVQALNEIPEAFLPLLEASVGGALPPLVEVKYALFELSSGAVAVSELELEQRGQDASAGTAPALVATVIPSDTEALEPDNDDAVLNVWVPFSCDVSIRAASVVPNVCPDVSVERVEGRIDIEGDAGACRLKSMKSPSIAVNWNSGVVHATSLHTDLDVRTQSAKVVIGKTQGNKIDINTASGQIDCKALYADDISISSSQGEIALGEVHGSVHILSDGTSVFVGSVDGSIDAKSQGGLMDVYLNRIKRPSFLEAGGGLVNVGVSPDLDAHLQIDSRETDLEALRELPWATLGDEGSQQVVCNQGSETVHVSNREGLVEVRPVSWMDASFKIIQRVSASE
eukprot:m.149725 g.149725  ORF g.149725 m.149725 type:complete len:407 (-) comp17354_c0_seq6:54-1274(-)